MKTICRSLLLTSLAYLGAASLASAALPPMDVKIMTAAGKIVFQGKTDAKGMFETKDLPAGNYVAQFNAPGTVKGGPFALLINAGGKKAYAESVPGSKFSKGGVAIKVEVEKAVSLNGQVATAGHLTLKGNESVATKDATKVKFVNGKKYVWIAGSLGSNLGGRWVEAGSVEANNVESMGGYEQQRLKDHADSIPAGGR